MTSKKKNKEQSLIENQSDADQALWKQFVLTCAAHIDPVLASIFHSTDVVKYDKNKQVIEVITYKKFMLFQDLFIEQKPIYQKHLNQLFGYQVMLMIQFTKADQPHVVVKNQPTATAAHPVVVAPKDTVVKTTVKEYSKRPYKSAVSQELALNEKPVDVSDKQKWKITNQLLQHFGGSVKEIIKDLHEFDA